MPAYDYHCDACGSTYELRQGFHAETTHVCEECGKGTAKRVLHAPRVVFKGAGWYATDSRKTSTAVDDAPAAPATDAPAAASSEAAAPSTAPAKSAPAKESGSGASAPAD